MPGNCEAVANAFVICLIIAVNVEVCENALDVIEVPVKPLVIKYEVRSEIGVIKLKCNIFKDSFNKNRIMSVNELRWENKKCGYGLHLTNCANFKTLSWNSVMCKNGTKFCDGYTLKINNPTTSDSGYYRCLYKNYMSKQFKVYRMFYLDVYDPEGSFEILDEPAQFDNQIVYVNDSVTFRCRARSLSPLHMMWAKLILPDNKGNRPIKYGTHTYELLDTRKPYNFGNDLYISKLTLANSQLSDNGRYYCIIISIHNARLLKNKSLSLTVMPVRRNNGHTVLSSVMIQFTALCIIYCSCSFKLIYKNKG